MIGTKFYSKNFYIKEAGHKYSQTTLQHTA